MLTVNLQYRSCAVRHSQRQPVQSRLPGSSDGEACGDRRSRHEFAQNKNRAKLAVGRHLVCSMAIYDRISASDVLERRTCDRVVALLYWRARQILASMMPPRKVWSSMVGQCRNRDQSIGVLRSQDAYSVFRVLASLPSARSRSRPNVVRIPRHNTVLWQEVAHCQRRPYR